ncbi:hypothetical protein [Nocardioides hwasunensis]|uniref:Uncharacterized protein n=1 Tax=Nocardioides hwasunensis TaxID=397258 RepID=A0ABR8MJM6_9ACTN|nr:hypothetical protein [Nocardioides hwasunensis]MBD3916187.1 hypothetical protein [Nocardioides hwasunensis]
MENVSGHDARRSLDAVAESRREVAARLRTPRWYYPALGLLVAQMVAAHGLLASPLAVLSSLAVAVGAGWLVHAYASHAGVVARFPDSLRSGLALAVFAAGIMVPVLIVVLVGDLAATSVLLLAASALVATVVLGPVYDAVNRADLRRRAAA